MTACEKAHKKNGPYKLLALDGDGIRGVITLAVLEKKLEHFANFLQ